MMLLLIIFLGILSLNLRVVVACDEGKFIKLFAQTTQSQNVCEMKIW